MIRIMGAMLAVVGVMMINHALDMAPAHGTFLIGLVMMGLGLGLGLGTARAEDLRP